MPALKSLTVRPGALASLRKLGQTHLPSVLSDLGLPSAAQSNLEPGLGPNQKGMPRLNRLPRALAPDQKQVPLLP
jgi:hypothetical protein